jgi:hypothetical protein
MRGSDIEVDDKNKFEYVELTVKHWLNKKTKSQIEIFLQGSIFWFLLKKSNSFHNKNWI